MKYKTPNTIQKFFQSIKTKLNNVTKTTKELMYPSFFKNFFKYL